VHEMYHIDWLCQLIDLSTVSTVCCNVLFTTVSMYKACVLSVASTTHTALLQLLLLLLAQY
jgi:hypothetical protein